MSAAEDQIAVAWSPLPQGVDGLAYMEAMREGSVAPPPMLQLIGGWASRVERGLVQFTASPTELHSNSVGTVHGGFVATLLDSASGGAAHTVIEHGASYSSIEIKVSYLRAITAGSGPITATARVTKTGSRIVFVEATAADDQGRTVATSSSSLLVIPPTS
jgi:uncharacterized protein (TIGR00369 family)